jgi:SAM-dependent methyltransferase
MERRRWNERYASRNEAGDPDPLVIEALEQLPPGRALDVAAGAGRHARWLAAHGWHVVAVDFSDVALRRTRTAGVHPIVADIHTLPLPAAAFDLILLAYFHPRPAERPALYPRLAQALAPGGTLLLVTYERGEIDPDFLMDVPATAAALRALGLEIVRQDQGDASMPSSLGRVTARAPRINPKTAAVQAHSPTQNPAEPAPSRPPVDWA